MTPGPEKHLSFFWSRLRSTWTPRCGEVDNGKSHAFEGTHLEVHQLKMGFSEIEKGKARNVVSCNLYENDIAG